MPYHEALATDVPGSAMASRKDLALPAARN